MAITASEGEQTASEKGPKQGGERHHTRSLTSNGLQDFHQGCLSPLLKLSYSKWILVSSPHSNVNAINLKIIELLTKVINGNSWSFSKINSSLESTSSMLYPVWLWYIIPLNDSLKKKNKNPNLSIYHQVHLCLWSQQDQHLAYTIAGNQEPILSYKEL